MKVTACPSVDDFQAFRSGRLPVELRGRLADHLSVCAVCQSTMRSLQVQTATEIMAVDESLRDDPFVQDPDCRLALADVDAEVAARRAGDRTEARPAANEPNPALGRVGQYEIEEMLGQGGMGTVYRARHPNLNRIVALKVLAAGQMAKPEAVARFHREMEAIGQLDHPNIVRATDAGTHYLVMEFVDGIDLANLVKRRGRISIADACELARQAAVGLEHVHQHGLVHRDIKPSNLLLAKTGQVKVADLGLALLRDNSTIGEDLTDRGQILGTLDYLAPEQALDTHAVDIRADLYSLGCTLYHLLVGRPPFSAPQFQNVLKKTLAHAQVPAPPVREQRPDVPEALAVILHRLLAKDPAQRFATPAEVAAALAPFAVGCDLAGLATERGAGHAHAAGDAIKREVRKPSRLTPRTAAAGLAAAAVLAVAGYFAPAVYRMISNKGVRSAAQESSSPHAPPPSLPPLKHELVLTKDFDSEEVLMPHEKDGFNRGVRNGVRFLEIGPDRRDGTLTDVWVLKKSAVDMECEIRFRLQNQGKLLFLFRVTRGDGEFTCLTIYFFPGGDWEVRREFFYADEKGDWNLERYKNYDTLVHARELKWPLNRDGEWNQVRVIAWRNIIRLEANDRLAAQVIDPHWQPADSTALPRTLTYVRAESEEKAIVELDFIKVWLLEPMDDGERGELPIDGKFNGSEQILQDKR